MSNTLQHTYHIPGAPAAGLDIRFKTHAPLTLLHVSAAAGSGASEDQDASEALAAAKAGSARKSGAGSKSGERIKDSAPAKPAQTAVLARPENAGSAVLKIGSPEDEAAYLPGAPLAGSGQPLEFGREAFSGGQYPHLPSGATVIIRLDPGEAAPVKDVTLVVTFLEG